MKSLQLKQFDWVLFGLAVVLVVISVAMIYSLTVGRVDGNLALNQAVFGLIGVLSAIGLAQVDYRVLRTLSVPLFVVGLLLLIAVLLVGTTVFGATRWIDIVGFQFQPSELMKVLLIIFLAHVATNYTKAVLDWKSLLMLLVAVVAVIVLVLLQPDLGTAAILTLVTIGVLVIARLPGRYWLALTGLALVGLPLLWTQLQGYQVERFRTFFQPTTDPLGSGYNVLQSLIAVGNGGLFGQGVGQGTQSQLDFLPVVHTDFIFAGIAESVGLLGSLLLLGIFTALLLRALSVARAAPDNFGVLLAVGVATLWLVQLAVNIGMNLGLAPVTGIPLPFVSYGGTALIVNFLALGVLESVARRSSTVHASS